MAKLRGLRASTTHRYATTTQALGWLEQTSNRRYRVGSRAADVAISFLEGSDIRRASREHLRRLRDETGYTVAMAVLDGIEMVYIDQFRGHRRGQFKMDDRTGAGVRVAPYSSAAGRALLAHLDPDEREAIIDRLCSAGDGSPSIPRRRLVDSLREVRNGRYGTAIVHDEARGGFSLAAAVIGSPGKPAGAVEIAASTSSTALTEDLIAALSVRLTATVVCISLSLPKT